MNRKKVIKAMARAIDPQVFCLPRINLYKPRYDEAIECATAALDAALSAGLCGEREVTPAAWRVRPSSDFGWSIIEGSITAQRCADQGYEVQPLYAPSPDREAAIRREALEDAIAMVRAQLPEGGARPAADLADKVIDATRRGVIRDLEALIAPSDKGGADHG